MAKLTLEQVLKLAPADRKKKIEGMAKGSVGVYCVAIRDKVKLTSAYFEVRHQKNNRTIITIVGSSPECKTMAGKKTEARSIVVNMATKDYKKSGTARAKSPKRVRSRSRSRTRSARSRRSRRRSGSRRRSASRTRSTRSRRRRSRK